MCNTAPSAERCIPDCRSELGHYHHISPTSSQSCSSPAVQHKKKSLTAPMHHQPCRVCEKHTGTQRDKVAYRRQQRLRRTAEQHEGAHLRNSFCRHPPRRGHRARTPRSPGGSARGSPNPHMGSTGRHTCSSPAACVRTEIQLHSNTRSDLLMRHDTSRARGKAQHAQHLKHVAGMCRSFCGRRHASHKNCKAPICDS